LRVGPWELKISGSDAEHGVGFAIERKRLPNDVGIRREVTLPVLVAQNHSLGFVLGKRTPADGIYAQNAKKICGDRDRPHFVRFATTG